MNGIKILLFAFIIGFIGLVNVDAETCSYNYSADGSTVTFTVYFSNGNISSTEFSGGVDTYKKIEYDDEDNLVLKDAISTSVDSLKISDFKDSEGNIDCNQVKSIYIDANVTSNSVWEIYNISTSSGSNIATTVKNAHPRDYLYSRIVGFSLSNEYNSGGQTSNGSGAGRDEDNSEEGGFTSGGQASENSNASRYDVLTADSFCQGAIEGVFTTIGWVFFILKIIVPIILIVMSSIDLSKVIVSNKYDELPKQIGVLAKRIILGIFIFFIPTILSFVVSLIGGEDIYDENSGTFGRCTYCMLNPRRCDGLGDN